MALYPPSVEAALTGVPRSKGSKVFVVDYVNGSDSNSGLKWESPLKTVEAAYALCTTLKNDVVLLVGNGTSNVAAAAITWAKDYTHLIGLCAPSPEPRSRIKNAAALATTPFITWSASGCIVKNISFWHESTNAAALVNVLVSGGRNYFEGCQFAGGVGTNNASGARSLQVGGANASGNVFKHCYIGQDTIQMVSGNMDLEFVTGAMHTLFEDCIFQHTAGAAANSFVTASAAASVGRLNVFRNCLFWNESATTVTMTEVFTLGAALAEANRVCLIDCYKYGATKWDSNNYGLINNGIYATAMTGTNAANNLLITSG
jgi:hypothetical protein